MANISLKVVFRMPFDLGAQKIVGTTLDIHRIVVLPLLVIDKTN